MQKLIALLICCGLLACSDGNKSSKPDAGGQSDSDAGDWPDEDGGETTNDAGVVEGLERAPGSLQRSPGNKLPADLKPPR